jgi:hypothetical protein
MSGPVPATDISPADRAALKHAVELLERSSFAMKVADLAGQPVQKIIGFLPGRVRRYVMKPVESAIYKCLEIAVNSLDDVPEGAVAEPPSRWMPRLMTGLTGGISGFFGGLALPLELPVTTTLMLRSIAEIARHAGEDLKSMETGMACLEVFALGDTHGTHRSDVTYYTTRAALAKLASDAVAAVSQRGTVDATSPAVMHMVAEVAQRFGWAVSERAAASAMPMIGALGGATANVLFVQHYQRLAEGHFLVRRLERHYGEAEVQTLYRQIARDKAPARS